MSHTPNMPAAKKGSRERETQLAAQARGMVIAVVLFTVLNLAMLLIDEGKYFLFSASVPYYLTWFGKILDNGTSDAAGSTVGTYTVTALVIAAVILAVYVVFWVLSKKRGGWLTAAAVLFAVDTVALIVFAATMLEEPLGCLLDMVFHVFIAYVLVRGVVASHRLKTMPEEEAPAEAADAPVFSAQEQNL